MLGSPVGRNDRVSSCLEIPLGDKTAEKKKEHLKAAEWRLAMLVSP
jgi:hypothetical protein